MPDDPKKLPKPEPLTKGEQFSVGAFSWSPDGKRIAFSASRDPDLGSSDTEQLYVLDLADLHVKKLLESRRPERQPQVVARWQARSPTSRPTAQQFFFYTNRYIAVIPADGGSRACSPRTSTKIRT